jgi:transposase
VIPHGVEIFVGIEAIDLRWGFERLSGLVSDRLGRAARCGALFVFRGKRGDTIKVLFYDGTGLCLFLKRLDRGTFRWPESLAPGATSIAIDERALESLLDGIDVEAPSRRVTKLRPH